MGNVFYKYFVFKHGASTLSNLQLRLSDPQELNDPFEFNPKVDLGDISFEEADAFWRSDEGLKIIYDSKMGSRSFNEADFVEFKKHFLEVEITERVNSWMLNRECHAKQISYKKTLGSSRFHIICGSKNPISILMWSHYTEDHKGVVIGFNLDVFPFPEFYRTGNFLNVDYVDERPVYKHRLNASVDYKLSEFRKIASRKYKDWKYEEEMRVIVPLGPKTLGQHIMKEENDYYLILSHKVVSRVIIGARADDADKILLKRLLNSSKFSHVALEEAFLAPDTFALQVRPFINLI